MQILTWNINGIRAVEKKGFTQWITKAQPDVLCLQEVKATLDQVPQSLQNIPGYSLVWNAASKPGYSGTAIYTKEKFLSSRRGFGIKRFDDEGRVIQVDFKEFTLFNVYFPNGDRTLKRVPYKLEFYRELLEYCKHVRKKQKNIIICGDFNTAHKEIDLKNAKANEKNTGFRPEERAWIDKYLEQGFVDIFRSFHKGPGQYTWWTYRMNTRARNIGWRIDYHLVTKEMQKHVKDAYILKDVMGSDHCPAGIEVDLS